MGRVKNIKVRNYKDIANKFMDIVSVKTIDCQNNTKVDIKNQSIDTEKPNKTNKSVRF